MMIAKMGKLLVLFVMLLSLLPLSHPQTASAAGTTYYVDSVGGNDTNSGTSTSAAWKTLTKVNGVTFQPGDKISFKAGGSWTGQLHPLGSGSNGSPIVIDMYGTGNKPVIDGNGLIGTGTVYLSNQQYWEINNLEIINNATASDVRFGIYVELTNFGIANHIYVKNNYIHDIAGSMSNPHSGVGIFFYVPTAGDNSRFNDILIQDNNLYKVYRSGIIIRSQNTNASYYSTNVVIRGNTLNIIGGDGIVPKFTAAPLVEYNSVQKAGSASAPYDAGIWSWQSDDSLFQYNESFLMQQAGGGNDATGYDCDYNDNRTIFQYNYSHENYGGFMLVMGGSLVNSNITIRYNISENENKRIFSFAGNAPTGFTAYNNTFYIPATKNVKIIDENNGSASSLANASFYNNIIYNLSSASSYFVNSGTWDYNNFYNPNGVPTNQPTDAHAITTDPQLQNPGTGGSGINFNDPNRLSGYMLKATSPLINAGKSITSNGGKDFWGNPLYNGAPDIGANEYPAPIIVDNGDANYVESGANWATSTLTGYNGTTTRYNFTDTGAYATWTPNIKFAGNYRVYIYKVVYATSDTNAKIDIVYNGGTNTQYLNYTTGTSDWVDLGVFNFASGTAGYVKNTRSNNNIRADAVKFVKQ